MPGAKGRSGGARPGAGRPRKNPPKPPPIDWRKVRAAAEAGADEPEIIRWLALPEVALEHPANLTRFRDEISKGHASYKIELRMAIRARGLRTARGAGSVQSLALQARNHLDWDKQIPTQEVEPDLGTARQRLRDLFVKLAQTRSEIEGKPVTVLDLLRREAQTDVASEDTSGAE